MNLLGYISPFLFIGMWCLVIYIISRMGWSDLAGQFQTGTSFSGHRVGIISVSINGANYNNSLILRYNADGIYLRPIWLFRAFHKPLLIPWSEIKEVRDKKILFFRFKELIIGHPFIAKIAMKNAVFALIKSHISPVLLK